MSREDVDVGDVGIVIFFGGSAAALMCAFRCSGALIRHTLMACVGYYRWCRGGGVGHKDTFLYVYLLSLFLLATAVFSCFHGLIFLHRDGEP